MTDLSANTNLSAMSARRYMERNSRMTSIATQELASGYVTFDPSRKPSEAAVGARLDAKISNLAQATKNANQLIAMIQMGTGTLETTQNIITRMQALTGQANNSALDDGQRAMLDQEYQQLLTQVTNLAQMTRWGDTQLFNGSAASVANSGAVTQAFTVNGMTNAFANTFNTGNTQGQISGIVTDATVVANGNLFDVNITFGDGKVFAGSVSNTPVAGDIVVFKNTKDASSSLALAYDSAVSAFDGTAATYLTNLKTNLGIGSGNRSFGTTGSIAMYTGATVTAGSSAAAGTYAMTYSVSNNVGTFHISDGQHISTGTVASSASITQTVNVGNFTLSLSAFNGSANLGQTAFTVTAASTLTMSGQIEELSSDTVSINFKSATASALGINGTSVATINSAATANGLLKSAAATVAQMTAELGGKRSQLDFQVDNLKISQQNQAAAKSTYTDTNIAEATERLVQFKALSGMSSNVFTQAIQDTQRLAQLLDRVQ